MSRPGQNALDAQANGAAQVGAERLARYVVPPIPDPAARWLSRSEVAGLLRITPYQLGVLMTGDPRFPRGHVFPTGGFALWETTEVEGWVRSLAKGWTRKGGRREPKPKVEVVSHVEPEGVSPPS